MSDLVIRLPAPVCATGTSAPASQSGVAFMRSYGNLSQTPAEIAVVLPSIWRNSLEQALRSAIEQDFPGNVQIVLSFDIPNLARLDLDRIIGELPPNRTVLALYPGYSTSRRHGGLYPAFDGGALRVVSSYLANARYLTYLDDDNWWVPSHLSLLHASIQGVQWAFTWRWFVNPLNDTIICIDDWESVGPDRGVYQKQFGGFVDPNCLMIDKIACDPVLRRWTTPLPDDPGAMSADRNIFADLRAGHSWRAANRPTVYYRINPNDPVHGDRAGMMRQLGVNVEGIAP